MTFAKIAMNNNSTLTTMRRSSKKRPPLQPSLRFTPTAWAKLLVLRDLGDTEIGGFGIAASDDPLLITDIGLVTQSCSIATVEFDDSAVAEFFDSQVDLGLHPTRFGRVWIHTHPGKSAEPSGTDEETFARVFGDADWAVMFILARGGQTYCRLEYHIQPAAGFELPVEIDYEQQFEASDHAAWEADYRTKVHKLVWQPNPLIRSGGRRWPARRPALDRVRGWAQVAG
jgi:proteasome lid subunit RPN8/RPN11